MFCKKKPYIKTRATPIATLDRFLHNPLAFPTYKLEIKGEHRENDRHL